MADEETDRKATIIRGAFDALSRNGLPDLSYDLVAEAAGVSRQLVRYYFPDREALMMAVCDHLAQTYREALIETAGKLEGPRRIEAFLDFYFDLLDETPKPRDDQVYDAMMSVATRSETVRGALADQYGLLGQVLAHEFQVQYPEIDQRAAEELSYLFVCLMYGHWKMVASLGYAEHHRLATRTAMNRLIRSYAATGAQGTADAPVWQKAPR